MAALQLISKDENASTKGANNPIKGISCKGKEKGNGKIHALDFTLRREVHGL